MQLPGSPFKGLASFEASDVDAMLFFGREREREIIAANLQAARLTVLYGPTGVGKSSVLKAGVAHQLRGLADRNMNESGRPELAVVVFSSWSVDPVQELRDAAERALSSDATPVLPPASSLADVLQTWTEQQGLELYLILDQVEEYFVYHGLESGAGTLAEELPEVVTRPGLHVNTLLSLREDTLAALDSLKARIPSMLANRLRLDHLDRSAGRAAIVGPLEAYNGIASERGRMRIEPELVDAVLDQVAAGAPDFGLGGRGRVQQAAASGRIEAPYLQLVMQRLWEVETSLGSHTLRLDSLNRLGGAQRIVADHLEHALAALTPSERDAAARIFNYLVTPSGIKVAQGFSDLSNYAAVAEPGLRKVLTRLSAERILRPLSDGANGGGRYEIFHDVLAEAVLGWRRRHEAAREVDRAREEAARRTRVALVVAGTALLALAVMIVIAAFALTQRSEAKARAREARARELAATALADLSADPQRSLALAVAAASLERAPEVEAALRQSLLASHLRRILAGSRPLTGASFDRGGAKIVTASGDGKARLYNAHTGALLHVLVGADPLTTASFSPDGRLVLTGDHVGSARIWNVRDGRLLQQLRHHAAIDGASFSPDGKLVVTASVDRTVGIWRVKSGALVERLRQREPILGASFSPDGTRVLTMTEGAAWLFSSSGGRLLHRFRHGGGMTSASFSPNGRIVVTTSRSKRAFLWDARTGRRVHVLPGHRGQVTTASFGPHGNWLVTASTDGAARVWDVATGMKVAVLPGHQGHVTDASFSPEGKWVVTASRDRTARIFVAASGLEIAELIGHRDSVVSASYAPTGDAVVTASKDGTARVWDPGTEPELRRLGIRRASVRSISSSHDGRMAVSAGSDGTARIWRLRDRHRVGLVRHDAAVTSASFSPDDASVLTTSLDRTARISRGGRSTILRQGGPVIDGSFSPDGRLVVTAGADGAAIVWRVRAGARLHVLRHAGAVRTVRFSPDGHLVVTASDDRTARVWDVASGRLRYVLRGHDDALVGASFSPDGRSVVTASKDRTARLWNAGTGDLVHVLRGHRRALTSASFSPDARLVVTSSRDGDARIWSTTTGQTLHVLRGHFTVVNEAQFSPDGRWVVTAGPGTAGLWPTQTGQLLLYLFGHHGPLTSAVFGPRSRRILTSGEDGTVRMYACQVCPGIGGLESLAKLRLAQIAHGLSPSERRKLAID